MSRAPAIGIDLGTSYSCVGVWQYGKVDIIPNDMGKRITPSYVAFTDSERLIGDEAKNILSLNPTNTIFNAKKLIGRKFQEQKFQNDIRFWPFKVVKDEKSDRPQIQIMYQKQEKRFFAEEIIALIFQELKRIATNFIGKEVKDAVVAVPNHFTDLQRQAIKDAGKISGLNILRFYSGATVASFPYYLSKKQVREENILIFDLGSANCDISLLLIEDGLFEVRAANGNTNLGGEDFDNRLLEYCAGEFRKNTSIDILKNPEALKRVKESCEIAKRKLSEETYVTIHIDNLMHGEDLNVVITRSKFEDLCIDLFKKCIYQIETLLKDAKMSKSEIDEVLLVGGSSRIPKIQQLIQEYFNGKELNTSVNPDEAMAYGAAVCAAKMTNVKDEDIDNLVILDVTPFSLGIEVAKGENINFPGNELIQSSLNIKIDEGKMNVIIPRNTILPIRKKQIFSTYSDNQSSVFIQIFEGESQFTKDNNQLGSFILEGIPPMPRGQPPIEVIFDIDANSILNITAKEKSTGKSNKIVITNDKGRLGKDDFDRIIKEAQKFEYEDNKIRENKKAKKQCEQYCHQIKKDVKIIERKIDEVLKWVNDNPPTSKEEYDLQFKGINPIIEKLYLEKRDAEGASPLSSFPLEASNGSGAAYIGTAEDVE